jgi:hypothetical protein
MRGRQGVACSTPLELDAFIRAFPNWIDLGKGLASSFVVRVPPHVSFHFPARANMIQWWRNHAPIFGTVAQWLAAICTMGTLGIAVFGIWKVSPVFENLNLREVNAKLQIDQRALQSEKRSLEVAIAIDQEQLKEANHQLRRAVIEKACRRSAMYLVTVQVAGLVGHPINQAEPPMISQMWNKASTEALPARYILDAILSTDLLDELGQEDRKAITDAWRAVEQRRGIALDTIFIPKLTDGKPIEPPNVGASGKVFEIVDEFRDSLTQACDHLIPLP